MCAEQGTGRGAGARAVPSRPAGVASRHLAVGLAQAVEGVAAEGHQPEEEGREDDDVLGCRVHHDGLGLGSLDEDDRAGAVRGGDHCPGEARPTPAVQHQALERRAVVGPEVLVRLLVDRHEGAARQPGDERREGDQPQGHVPGVGPAREVGDDAGEVQGGTSFRGVAYSCSAQCA